MSRSSEDAAFAFHRACFTFLASPASVLSRRSWPSAMSSSSRATSSTCVCWDRVVPITLLLLASSFWLATVTSPSALTSAVSSSFSSSSSSSCSWSSSAFSCAASRIPFLAFSAIQTGTSSLAALNSALLHAAQRFAHLRSSDSRSAIHWGTSLPSALKRLTSCAAHFAFPLFSSSETSLSIHSGTVSFCSMSCLVCFLAHSRVACCSMRSFLCFQVSCASSLHHVGALSGRGPKEPSTKLKCSSPSTTSIPSLTEEALDCRRKVPSCWAIAPPASREAKQTAVRAMILRTGAETR
mmetsp:Transcript_95702/g.252866  ORF Transcript_95702/g.252866 Transcript_95702/m.252866 type:complete len:296 (-) Transcript_95702:55-942(-)